MISRLLDAADLLLEKGRRSGAFRRRAVSTAYYAVFHCLAKCSAGALLFEEDTDEYVRVYRSLDHGPLKNAFATGVLKERETFLEIGSIVILLQSERHKADYLPPTSGAFGISHVRELVDQARNVVAAIEQLSPEDRRTLAAHLLFKNRTS